MSESGILKTKYVVPYQCNKTFGEDSEVVVFMCRTLNLEFK